MVRTILDETRLEPSCPGARSQWMLLTPAILRFAYLKLLLIDTLKIDRSFVIGISDNADDKAVILTLLPR